MELKSCGICCGIFSSMSIIFLLTVAGVINSGSKVIAIDLTKTTKSEAVTNLYTAAGIYAGFLLLSVFCVFWGSRKVEGADQPAIKNQYSRAAAGLTAVSAHSDSKTV